MSSSSSSTSDPKGKRQRPTYPPGTAMPPPEPGGVTTSWAPPPHHVATGVNVPQWVDERCLSYCTQRSGNRTFQGEPTCHVLCWRKIYEHEQRLLDAASLPGQIGINSPGTSPQVDKWKAERARLRSLTRRFAPEREKQWKSAASERKASLAERPASPPPVEGRTREGGDELRGPEKTLQLETDTSASTSANFISGSFSPFPPPPNNIWSFLRGHYIFYGRGPDRVIARTRTMGHIGHPNNWYLTAKELEKDGESVGAILESSLKEQAKLQQLVEAPGAVGMKHLHAEENWKKAQKKERRKQTDYIVLISLEHLPFAMYSSAVSTLERVTGPLGAFFTKYQESFTSGQQVRTMRRIWSTVKDPEYGPMGMFKRATESWERLRKEEIDKSMREKGKERSSREKE
ncbi:hypothetical protein DACRYDRAFT_119924 [Dacryopinax primogenitus]|uniref:Uncharacterized protein n=1 Tax=Dacryopinax primogenitus (strain DJM 731) TaxID=1858805 RepID=M5FP14_DACPD|nr:uncharacterized protein DACRYDRAFT_119924 [Dacryopinax primogenitus]EJT96708.1 hypothetical protein DACRYDRAFT_119924 [Dacryopinax primogenitus]